MNTMIQRGLRSSYARHSLLLGIQTTVPCAVRLPASGAVLFLRRTLCVAADEDKYLELKQLKDIKSEVFYDEQNLHRRYFYYIDLQGRLFLENTRPKNIATSLKSAKFLRFFFSQIRPNRLSVLPAAAVKNGDGSSGGNETPMTTDELESIAPFLEYPYRSPCGKEMNFIKCADRPLVFEELRRREDGGGSDGSSSDGWEFVFGGGELTMPFRPDALKISLTTGRLYHDVETRHFPAGNPSSVGLVRSQVAVELGRTIQLHDDVDNDDTVRDSEAGDGNNIVGEFEWEGKTYPIRSIE